MLVLLGRYLAEEMHVQKWTERGGAHRSWQIMGIWIFWT